MTEAEWVGATDPQPMLEFLRGKVSDRKLRLIACACCRRIWHYFTSENERQGVEIAERYADGQVSHDELGDANLATGPGSGLSYGAADYSTADYARGGSIEMVCGCAAAASREVAWQAYVKMISAHIKGTTHDRESLKAACRIPVDEAGGMTPLMEKLEAAERREQAAILRDITQNPFRRLRMRSAWLTPAVAQVAQDGYNVRSMPEGALDSTRLAILADALENAGCSDATILEHLRASGPHYRGCFVLDAILGKK